MSAVTPRAVLHRVGLLVTGLLVLALTLAVVGLGTARPAPGPDAIDVAPVSVGSGATTWVCPAAPTLPTAQAGSDLEYDPALGTGGGAVATQVDLSALGAAEAPSMTVGPLGEEPAEAGTAGELATSSTADVAAPVVGVVEPTPGGVPLVAGVGVARADGGDLRGLSAATCQRPVTSAVLVAGSTELGSSTRLVLSNPGDTPATVTLTGWGATGPLPEIAPVVVPSGGVRAVLLETISLEPRIAVRIEVEGGRVVPTLQDSALDGLVPAGTETVGPAADPATTVVIGGTDLTDADGASAALRLVNPGETAATVTVEMLGPDGPAPLDGAVDSVVEPGTVADISLAGVAPGTYGVRVTSDVPVTGAVRMLRTGTAGEVDPDTPVVEVAWLPATVPVDRGVLPVPTDLVDASAITVTNPGGESADVTVTAIAADGSAAPEATVRVAAGATAAVAVPDGTVVVVLEGSGFVASQLLTAAADDGTLLSAIPVVPDPYVEQSVTVRVDD